MELEEDTNIENLLKNIEISDIEIDARFNKDGYREFSFERLKKYDDCTEKYTYKEQEKATVTLDQCFEVLEKPEELEKGNEWYCPHCKDHKLATKELTIYKAPDVLILHLKRFKSKGIVRKEKNEANVLFPLNLDLGKYVIDPKPMSTYIEDSVKEGVYIKPNYNLPFDTSAPPKYDLYAISNHFGGLGGGHYTAYAKNNGQWFQFNDSSVHSVSE